jgi:hypothetical protein
MGSELPSDDPDLGYWDRLAVINPIVGIRFFGGTFAEAVRNGSGSPPPYRKKAGDIVKELSKRSRLNLAKTVFATDIIFNSMATLTYGDLWPKDGKKCKRDLNRFLVWFRYHYGGNYLWFWEFQTRGAPHCHLLLEQNYPGKEGHQKFARAWVKAQKLDPDHIAWDKKKRIRYNYSERVYRFHLRKKGWEALREQEGAKRYCLMYALKPKQKKVPKDYQNVGVFWRASRGVTKSVRVRAEYDLDNDQIRAILALIDHSTAKLPFIPSKLFNMAKAEKLMGIPLAN